MRVSTRFLHWGILKIADVIFGFVLFVWLIELI
ncbi:hypothetical protein EC848_3547 [Enterobacter sp. BIGb0359]|nr:hypothetical protein EC848_3547 [Enterobacter sp. BIGb0359]